MIDGKEIALKSSSSENLPLRFFAYIEMVQISTSFTVLSVQKLT